MNKIPILYSSNTSSLVYYKKPKWSTHELFQKHIHLWNFTRVLIILHKRWLWCLWQISCLIVFGKCFRTAVYSFMKCIYLRNHSHRRGQMIVNWLLNYCWISSVMTAIKAFLSMYNVHLLVRTIIKVDQHLCLIKWFLVMGFYVHARSLFCEYT